MYKAKKNLDNRSLLLSIGTKLEKQLDELKGILKSKKPITDSQKMEAAKIKQALFNAGQRLESVEHLLIGAPLTKSHLQNLLDTPFIKISMNPMLENAIKDMQKQAIEEAYEIVLIRYSKDIELIEFDLANNSYDTPEAKNQFIDDLNMKLFLSQAKSYIHKIQTGEKLLKSEFDKFVYILKNTAFAGLAEVLISFEEAVSTLEKPLTDTTAFKSILSGAEVAINKAISEQPSC